MMAGFLLARAGVDVAVLEKHGDFFRDFRDGAIHPSTLELFHELGLLDEFLKLPHYGARELKARRRRRDHRRRFFASADAAQVHRVHAAVGFLELSRGARQAAAQLPPSHRLSREDGSVCLGRVARKRWKPSAEAKP